MSGFIRLPSSWGPTSRSHMSRYAVWRASPGISGSRPCAEYAMSDSFNTSQPPTKMRPAPSVVPSPPLIRKSSLTPSMRLMRNPSFPAGTPLPTKVLRNPRSSYRRISSCSFQSASTIGTPCCKRTPA